MDIRITAPYPLNVISNLYPNYFVFEGVGCASMEGLLQAFKFQDEERQLDMVRLVGLEARGAGQAGNAWKRSQLLWWNAKPYERESPEYQRLLDRAYAALCKNFSFQEALLNTGNGLFTHRAGRKDPKKTVLTAEEFVIRITKLRTHLIRSITV